MSTIAEFLPSAEAVGAWTLVPGQSRVEFKNKTMWGLATVSGRFTDFRGHGRISDAGAVSGELEIESASVDTGLRMRDRHLRSADFFHVDRFPQVIVVVTAASAADGDAVDVDASITVTGTTRPLPLRANVSRLEGGVIRVSAETTIDHDELGIRWNKLWAISRKTTISADLVFQHSEA